MMPTMPPDAHKISLKIIEAIKQHPVLYITDVKGTAIKLQEFRQKVWKKISDELGLDPAWVRLRWKNLRDTYCRILKYKNKTDKGSRRKKWIFEDHLSFLKFPYEPDYQPQCVELTDEYIEEINRAGITSENLLEQLEDRNDEDYSEYLEVLEETNADSVLEDNQIEILNTNEHEITEALDDYSINENQQDINIHAQQIKLKYRKIRPKRLKPNNQNDHTDENTDYGILNPNFKIEQLKLPISHNTSNNISSMIITNTTSINSSPINDTQPESVIDTKGDLMSTRSLVPTSTELFFNSMAQTVKLLPPKAQAEVKMAVCKIVTEAEVKYSKKKLQLNTQQFIAPPGMIPKLVLIPCSMIDNQENK
ncbi:uncharacterized protein [Chelonus insularis]|uniref:uncharacterized protein n=1 Tax=Chelonus insularis TaxID=460826 RepID=UPI00158E9760|nr:uncharacterized protein LOC118067124 [Chelonus insularis]XP_034939599.1 uncharacterized protein LOC118067124 [Chelonus insularis]